MTALTSAEAAFRLLCEARTFVVVDVETCPAADGDHVVSVAAATVRHGRRRSLWSTLVNPGVAITNSDLHQVTDEDVATAPVFADIADHLAGLVAGDEIVLVAHNASYDLRVLHGEYARLGTGQTLPDVTVLDTIKLPRATGHLIGRRPSLKALLGSLELVNSAPHRADSDASATAEALIALLEIAAGNGHSDIDQLLADAGAAPASHVGTGPSRPLPGRRSAVELPEAHLAAHLDTLPDEPTSADLDAWVALALECAELRCPLLADRAADAAEWAAELHSRLSRKLARFASAAQPGQGATLVGALNELAPHALPSRSIRPWWLKHAQTIKALPRCTATASCADCAEGNPCPLDVAHQPLARAACDALTGPVPKKRRRQVSGADTRCLVVDWCRLGLADLAGYAAWLCADAWASEGNHSRAATAIDQAISHGAHDPRIVLAYAQRLARQGRHDPATNTVNAALPHRNTDPAWTDLEAWHLHHLAERTRRVASPKLGIIQSTRQVRPAGRSRPRRFSLD